MKADPFIEECRREWKRLGVPAAVAEEMAAELQADLAEAAADDVPAEELLGAGAHDARGFAASWASERGVVPAARRRRPAPVVLAAALAVLALAVGLFAGRSGSHQVRPATSTTSIAAAAVQELTALQRLVARHHR